VYQASFVQQRQAIQELLREHADERGAQASKLILFDKFVQVYT
jgi:hypothetical protein